MNRVIIARFDLSRFEKEVQRKFPPWKEKIFRVIKNLRFYDIKKGTCAIRKGYCPHAFKIAEGKGLIQKALYDIFSNSSLCVFSGIAKRATVLRLHGCTFIINDAA